MSKRNQGFSLIEIMVVCALLGALSLVVMNLTQQSSKASSKFQFDTEINLITNEIHSTLSDPDKCLSTLTNAIPPAAPTANSPIITNIKGKYFISTDPLAPSNGYGNGNVKIESHTFSADPFPSNDGFLTIAFQNKNILKGTTGPTTVTRKINLFVDQDASGLITKCRSLSTSTTDIWSKTTPTSPDSFYMGKIGVGTTTPGATLDVAGDIRPGSTGITVGAACVNKGALANQLNATGVTPVFCSGNNTWKPVASSEVFTLSAGTHCDIGGGWGWRDNNSFCPAGTARTTAQCPPGSTAYGSGCYFNNSNPSSPYGTCGDSADECCFYVCTNKVCTLSGMTMTCN